MRFKIKDSEKEFLKLSEWHDWFAWYPVRTPTQLVWMETVKRKLYCHFKFIYRTKE